MAPTTPVREQDVDLSLSTPVKSAPVTSVATDLKSPTRKSSVAESLQGTSVVAISELSTAQIAEVVGTASRMKTMVATSGGDESLKGKVLATVFYEPSTRTNCSFQAAMLRLGGQVIAVNESSSSVAKGETLEDTVRCLECYCDAVVLRHPRAGAAAAAACAMSKPLLNAGDGVGEHPTQALLDLYTIIAELSSAGENIAASEAYVAEALKGKVITMVGDLKNGRTVHSLTKLLSRFDVAMRFVAPATLRMPAEITDAIARDGSQYSEHEALTEAILAETDILYVTRVQKERFLNLEDYEAVKDAFIITTATLAKMKGTARVMHPLPRVGEVDPACDSDPRAAYFRQMENGMYVRMALLRLILG